MQVAEQQGKYLARVLNAAAGRLEAGREAEPFKYRHLGSMASIGEPAAPGLVWSGLTAWRQPENGPNFMSTAEQ